MINYSLFLKHRESWVREITPCLASLGCFGHLLSVTYLGMLLSANDQIRSKAATPTASKF